jgi:hypothetical protein
MQCFTGPNPGNYCLAIYINLSWLQSTDFHTLTTSWTCIQLIHSRFCLMSNIRYMCIHLQLLGRQVCRVLATKYFFHYLWNQCVPKK